MIWWHAPIHVTFESAVSRAIVCVTYVFVSFGLRGSRSALLDARSELPCFGGIGDDGEIVGELVVA
jgi:hypothetical protein